MRRLIAEIFNLILTCFQLKLQIIQLAENSIQPLILCGQMLLCGLDDPFRDTELLTDKERVRLAGYADAQLIGRAQSLEVELTACVDNALGFQCENFQLCVVGRCHQQDTTAAKLLNDGDCQSGTLRRVGACTQLIQKDKRVRHGKLEDASDLLHVAREGRKALLDALFIADIHKEFVKDTNLASFIRRDEEAALCHCAKQTSCFQSDRLTAGIGAGDDKGIIFFTKSNIDRNAFLGVDERMPRANQRERTVCPNCRLKGFHLKRKACFCKQNVDFQHSLVAVLELWFDGGDLSGKGDKDALDFLCFLCAILKDSCVCFHNSLRFNEDGRTGRRNIVDDTAYFTAILALDRNNIATITHRDNTLL